MTLKRISKRLAIDYIHKHSNYILEGTSIDLGRELLVAQAQLEADQKAHRAALTWLFEEIEQYTLGVEIQEERIIINWFEYLALKEKYLKA